MPVAAMAFRLEDMERKLLRLALSPSAQGGEITTSATKLINALRARGVESSTIENALEGSNDAENMRSRHLQAGLGADRMPWGKHKGELLMDIPPSYLRWALQDMDTGHARTAGTARRNQEFSQSSQCLDTRSEQATIPCRQERWNTWPRALPLEAGTTSSLPQRASFETVDMTSTRRPSNACHEPSRMDLDEAEAAKTVASVFRHAPTRPASEDWHCQHYDKRRCVVVVRDRAKRPHHLHH